jgi:hypothetical protein
MKRSDFENFSGLAAADAADTASPPVARTRPADRSSATGRLYWEVA